MSSIDFKTTTPKVWMNVTSLHVPENLTTEEWFILNIQETGRYMHHAFVCMCVWVHVCARARGCMCECMHALCICNAPLLEGFYEIGYECHGVRSQPIFKFLFS
jgi:hypothetical protein